MSEVESTIAESEAKLIQEIAQDVAKLTQVKLSADPSLFLTSLQFSDKNAEYNILRRLQRIEEYLGMGDIQDEDEVFDFDSENFDGLKALRRMNREADEAISRASVVLEDTQRFLESRKIKPAP